MIEIRTLVAPSDGSETSAASLAVAEAMAERHGADLHVLHVEIVSPSGHGALAPDTVTADDLGGRKRLDVTRRAPSPGAAIVEYAAEVSADAIVMGTHGRSGWDRVVLGSTAEYVLRRAPCSVLTVGPQAAPFAQGPVLASVEFGDAEAGVIETAAGLAHHAGTRLIAFHAVEPLILPAPYAVEMGALGTDTLINDAKEALDERLETRISLPLARESVIRSGSAMVEILDLARERGAGLIVQGSHGRTGIGRALLGSVAEAVAKRATCPVLTLRRGARPLAVTDRDALTNADPVPRENWSAELEGLSFYAEDAPWAVSVGVVGLDARGAVLNHARLRGLAYDPHDDAIDVLAEGCDHRIARPLAVRIEGGDGGSPFTVEVVRRDGARERISGEPLAVAA